MTTMIRLAQGSDAAQIQAIYEPIVQNTIISFEHVVPTVAEMGERIDKILQQYAWLVLDVDSTVAGYAYASPHRARTAYQWSVDVSVYVHDQFRRQGVANALYSTVFDALKLQGYYNAYAGVALPNDASVSFHESMGFRPVGVYEQVGYKLGAWHDVGWWQLQLRSHDGQPKTPKPIGELIRTSAWDELLHMHTSHAVERINRDQSR